MSALNLYLNKESEKSWLLFGKLYGKKSNQSNIIIVGRDTW